jgi:hypothetical protein
MSLIVGINLSDGVYLSADTRLTFEVNEKQEYLDNFLKIKPLSQEIAVAVAGDIEIASFIVRKIIKSDINKENIREFRKSIEKLIKELADEYQIKHKRLRPVCFIFAGINRNQRKMIDMRKYHKIAQDFQRETGSPMNMKDIIFQGFQKVSGSGGPVKINSPIEIPTPDSHVFCVKILPQDLVIEDVAWGDFIAYGGGLTKKNLPPRFFGQLELAGQAGVPRQDRGWLDIFFKTVTEGNDIKTIGGCVTSFVISDKISGMLLGGTKRINRFGINEIISEVSIINKKLHCLIKNKKQRLISFILYENMLLKKCPNAEQLTL